MPFTLPSGKTVEPQQLARPIGLFTHFYIDDHGDPQYLIIREGCDQAFNPDVLKALMASTASNSYMVAVFTIDGQNISCHRVTNDVPHALFEDIKRELANNLDQEYQPPSVPKPADLSKLGLPGFPPRVAQVNPEDEHGVFAMQSVQKHPAEDALRRNIESMQQNGDVVQTNIDEPKKP